MKGHAVPWYQPETAYEVFRRASNDLDIATGKISTLTAKDARTAYSTVGPPSSLGKRQKLPPMTKARCYLLSLSATCPLETEARLRQGLVTITDYVVT